MQAGGGSRSFVTKQKNVTMKILKWVLRANGIFSLLSGSAALLFAKDLAPIFGVPGFEQVFRGLGFALVGFAISVLWLSWKPLIKWVLVIILMDFLWVMGSVLIVAVDLFHFSSIGQQAIATIGVAVLIFAVGQSYGMQGFDQPNEKGLKRLLFSRTVHANKETTWKTISDVGNYHRFAPNIDRVHVVSGEGEGMIRACSHKSNSWTEVATLWEEGSQYSFTVDTDAPDYPFPLSYLKGTWKVEEVKKNQTQIMMVFEFRYKRAYQNLVLHPFLKGKFEKICKELLDNWQREIEGKVA